MKSTRWMIKMILTKMVDNRTSNRKMCLLRSISKTIEWKSNIRNLNSNRSWSSISSKIDKLLARISLSKLNRFSRTMLIKVNKYRSSRINSKVQTNTMTSRILWTLITSIWNRNIFVHLWWSRTNSNMWWKVWKVFRMQSWNNIYTRDCNGCRQWTRIWLVLSIGRIWVYIITCLRTKVTLKNLEMYCSNCKGAEIHWQSKE